MICCQWLLPGANIDSTDASGCTPLFYACQRGHKEVVEVLVKKGANKDAKVCSTIEMSLLTE